MTELILLAPFAILAYFLWRADQRISDAQKLLTATLDEWSSDRTALLEQLSQTRTERSEEIAAERKEIAQERKEWAKERAQLLNRIQRPDMAVYENFEPTNLQGHVAHDDDEAYWKAQVNGGD